MGEMLVKSPERTATLYLSPALGSRLQVILSTHHVMETVRWGTVGRIWIGEWWQAMKETHQTVTKRRETSEFASNREIY